MRLIDADELIEIAHEMIQKDPDAFNGGYSYDAVTVEEINEAPTVETVPVVHGEWIYNQYYTWECGNCGFHPFKGFIPKEPGFNFCPNCGTDMRKKV